MIGSVVLKIKRRETPVFAFVYKTAKSIRHFNLPSVFIIHRPLYEFSRFLINMRWKLQQGLWSVPLFRTRCKTCGTRLLLPNGIPWVEGPLQLEIGNNVNIGQSTLIAGHSHDEPTLRIGNNSQVGYGTIISVNELVEIGDYVMMAHNCFIADSDGHPTDIERRRRHEALLPSEVKPVKIGNNVWIGAHCIILKGVTVGDNAILAANTVISKDVPANAIVVNSDTRIAKFLEN